MRPALPLHFRWIPKRQTGTVYLLQEDFMSNGQRFDAGKDSPEHLQVIRGTRLRLSTLQNRFDEMIQDRHSPVTDRLRKRNLLQSAAGTFDEYHGMIEISFFFVWLSPPEHSCLRSDEFPLSFPRSPRMAVAPVAVPDDRDAVFQSQQTMCA